MRIGNHSTLAEAARKSQHNAQFVNQFKKAGGQVLQNATDVLFKDHTSSQEAKDVAVDDLRDLRSAVMVCIDRVEDSRESNLKEIGKLGKEAFNSRKMARNEQGEEKNITHRYSDESINIYDPNGRRFGGTSYGQFRVYSPEKTDQMTGPKKFLGKLHQVVAVATAVAALPPGPIPLTVGTFAKEEATAQMEGQASGSQQSNSAGHAGLGLLGAWGSSSSGSFQASVNGDAAYTKISTDERVIASLDDLSLMMEQAKSNPANEAVVEGDLQVETEKKIERFILPDRTERVSKRSVEREIATHEFEPDRLWLPESGISEYQ